METHELISDSEIEFNLVRFDWECNADEGRLMLLELISKAGAGFYNSHSEESFMNSFNLLRKDRTPNKLGLRFIASMVYASSNKRADCFKLMQMYRD